jgi:hypothetical protein
MGPFCEYPTGRSYGASRDGASRIGPVDVLFLRPCHPYKLSFGAKSIMEELAPAWLLENLLEIPLWLSWLRRSPVAVIAANYNSAM